MESDSEISVRQKQLIENLSLYINQPRLDNVVSKIGHIDHPMKLIGPLAKDALEEFCLDYKDMDKNDEKLVKKRIGKLCANFIRKAYNVV